MRFRPPSSSWSSTFLSSFRLPGKIRGGRLNSISSLKSSNRKVGTQVDGSSSIFLFFFFLLSSISFNSLIRLFWASRKLLIKAKNCSIFSSSSSSSPLLPLLSSLSTFSMEKISEGSSLFFLCAYWNERNVYNFLISFRNL